MRIESYVRELTDEGYKIISTTSGYIYHDNFRGDPIRMSLTVRDSHIVNDNLDELILVAMPSRNVFDGSKFEQLYSDIMRGIVPGWQLGEVEVFSGGILLGYGTCRDKGRDGNHDDYDTGWIRIENTPLDLTYSTPRTRLGFDPAFRISIYYKDIDKTCLRTTIDEDFGYMRRVIEFKKHTELDNQDQHQTIYVTEYTGM